MSMVVNWCKTDVNIGANGSYGLDTLKIAGVSIPDFQFGVAEESTSAEAVFGIAFDYEEFTRTSYPNVVDKLVTQGVISSHTYSLFLDSPGTQYKANRPLHIFIG